MDSRSIVEGFRIRDDKKGRIYGDECIAEKMRQESLRWYGNT